MILVSKFKTENYYNGREGPEGYIYENIFPLSNFNLLKKTIKSTIDNGDRKTFLTNGSKINFDNKKIKLISNAPNMREQVVLYDISYEKEWYYQTKDTIKYWSTDYLKKSLNPIIYKYIHILENLEPFNKNKDDWIFYRTHINYLEYGKGLSLHIDAGNQLFNKKISPYTIDHSDCRLCSVTFYLYNHTPNMGGELWSPTGFVYKPKENSAICLTNGNRAIHGVSYNMNKDPRLAFTIRVAHKEDLFLPGHPDKYLYDVLGSL